MYIAGKLLKCHQIRLSKKGYKLARSYVDSDAIEECKILNSNFSI